MTLVVACVHCHHRMPITNVGEGVGIVTDGAVVHPLTEWLSWDGGGWVDTDDIEGARIRHFSLTLQERMVHYLA